MNKFHGLGLDIIKKISLQILQTLRLLDRYKIVHCDLKPENILFRSTDSCLVKVIDFGSACFLENRVYTYIQSRYYRAPEVILGLSYSTSIDMWSFGCILAELFTGKPLFAGENEIDQLMCIIEVLGLPPAKMIKKSTKKNLFFDSEERPKIFPNSKGKKRVPGIRRLKDVLLGADQLLLDIISQCFEWESSKRITPENALSHPWLQENKILGKNRNLKNQSESILKLSQLFKVKKPNK